MLRSALMELWSQRFHEIGVSGYLTPEGIRKRVPFSIGEISLDMLHAQQFTSQCPGAGAEVCSAPDERIASLIWSWAPGQPVDAASGGGHPEDCALLNGNLGRWESRSGSESHYFACCRIRGIESTELPDRLGRNWKITQKAGPWWEGAHACEELNRELRSNGIDEDCDGTVDEEDKGDYVFGAPVNGWQNERLKDALAEFRKQPGHAGADVWLAVHDSLEPGKWRLSRSFPDGRGRSTTLQFDGVEEASKVGMTPFSRQEVGLFLGASEQGRDFIAHFRGGLDELRVWNVALPPSQIRSNLFRRIPRGEPHLASYWRVDEGSGHFLHGTYQNVQLSKPSFLSEMGNSGYFFTAQSKLLLPDLGTMKKLTLSVWLQPAQMESYRTLFSTKSDDPYPLELGLSSRGEVEIYMPSNVPSVRAFEQIQMDPSRWTQLVVVYDSRASVDPLQLFLDGRRVGSRFDGPFLTPIGPFNSVFPGAERCSYLWTALLSLIAMACTAIGSCSVPPCSRLAQFTTFGFSIWLARRAHPSS